MLVLKMPIFGDIVRKATIARWARTTASLFAAGVPLVEALDSVAGASGNILYEEATISIKSQVNQGMSLTSGMQNTGLFPNMVLQMAAIGEESGSLDDMLNKAAEFYEEEVDTAGSQLFLFDGAYHNGGFRKYYWYYVGCYVFTSVQYRQCYRVKACRCMHG